MILRPKPQFSTRFNIMVPKYSVKQKLLKIYKSGGLKAFEPNVARQMGDFRIIQHPSNDPGTGEKLLWVYVGGFWWCRKHKPGFEFAQLMALTLDSNALDGLWDSSKHSFVNPPVSVSSKDGVRGNITGHNEFEVFVRWVNSSVDVPVRCVDDLIFDYVEDFKFYSNVFKNLRNKKC